MGEACQVLSGTAMPMRTWIRIERHDTSSIWFPADLRPDVSETSRIIFPKVEKLETLNTLTSVIETDPELSAIIAVDAAGKPLDPQSLKMWIRDVLVTPLLVDYFTDQKNFIFVKERAEAAIDGLVARLRQTTTRVKLLSPLLNVRLAIEAL